MLSAVVWYSITSRPWGIAKAQYGNRIQSRNLLLRHGAQELSLAKPRRTSALCFVALRLRETIFLATADSMRYLTGKMPIPRGLLNNGGVESRSQHVEPAPDS